MTGTRPRACATHHSTTFLCSSCDSVGLSPVVPTGTRPLVPSAICQSTRSRNAFSSTEPFLKGVTSAVKEPRKLVLAAMTHSLNNGPRDKPVAIRAGLTHKYRLAAGLESLFAALASNRNRRHATEALN